MEQTLFLPEEYTQINYQQIFQTVCVIFRFFVVKWQLYFFIYYPAQEMLYDMKGEIW